uniref:Centromere protein X n=1 Tax=Sus scrofa TaxID=9823 RepID=A0A8D1YI49_PIG
MEESGTGFRKELVSKLLHLHFKDDKTKVSGDALQLTAELLKVFVVEAAVRSVRQAQAEDLTRVDVDQLEKVLPQLVGAPPGAGPGPGAVGAGLAAPTGSEHAPRPPTAPGLLRLSTSPWLPACVTAKPRVHVSCGFYFQKGQELLPPGSPPLRQAQAEDLTRVDVDQLEKVLDRPASQQSAPPHVMLCLDAADGGLSGNPAHEGWRLGGALPYAPPGAAERPLGGRSTRRRSGPPANRPSVLRTQAESWGAATSVQAGLSPSSHLTLLRRCSPELCVCSHRAASVNQSRLSRHSLLPFIPSEPGCFQVGGRGGAGDAQQV